MTTKGVLRGSPACRMGCPDCTIRCAVVSGARDEALREVARARRAGDIAAASAAIAQLEPIEAAFERVRPRSEFELPIPTAVRLPSSTTLH
jgi:hypothetical protein